MTSSNELCLVGVLVTSLLLLSAVNSSQPKPERRDEYSILDKKGDGFRNAVRYVEKEKNLTMRPVSWRKVQTADGVPVEVPTLFLDEFDTLTSQITTCFANKHVGMMGYSLVRYQYLSLALFLEYGRWVPFDGAHFMDQPSPLIENQWREHHGVTDEDHWLKFYNGTHKLFRGNELCDCYRASTCSSTYSPRGWCTTENRYYAKHLDNGKGTLRLTYMASFGPQHSPRGHWFLSSSNLTGTGCTVGTCSPPHNWIYRDAAALQYILAPLDVSHLLWFPNSLYKDESGKFPEVQHMNAASRSALRKDGFGILYEGAYAANRGLRQEDLEDSKIEEIREQLPGWSNLHVLDIVFKLRKAFEEKHFSLNDGTKGFGMYEPGVFMYWDTLHYYPWVYEELNKALIYLLCS